MATIELVSGAVLTLLAFLFGEFICGVVGYAVVSIASLGLLRGQGAEDGDTRFPWHGFARSKSGKIVVEAQAATLIGDLFVLALVVTYIGWRIGYLSHV